MKQFILEGNTPSSKNSKQWTGRMLISNKRTLEWIKDNKQNFENLKDEFLEAVKDKEKPYHIYFSFVRKSRHKADFLNLCQCIFDEMKNNGWIIDDNMDEVLPFPLINPISKTCYSWDKDNPSTIITVL